MIRIRLLLDVDTVDKTIQKNKFDGTDNEVLCLVLFTSLSKSIMMVSRDKSVIE
jgi:hypothetical protein